MLRVVTYNLFLLSSVAMIGIGSGLRFGLPVGLIVTGACMLSLTLLMIGFAPSQIARGGKA